MCSSDLIWYPLTVATRSRYTREIIMESLRKTADAPEQEIEFKHHSFGYRGVSSNESAGIGGCAELLFSRGTDTVAGIIFAQDFYNATGMSGYSISASEHSTITAYGKNGEVAAYRNMLQKVGKPGGIFACVSDSYDIYNACENIWGGELRQEVIDSGATVVIRPDSGEPVEVVSKCLAILAAKFGFTVNSKGYKVLNNVRVIQGDGINIGAIRTILARINSEGFSTTNLAFGQGGGSLQKLDRDTFKMAMKCSCVGVNGELRDVYKQPVTDSVKNSKKGQLDLICVNGDYQTVDRRFNSGEIYEDTVLRTVYENGELLIDEDFETIRARANGQ